jgi:septal ring factor EnvC (AmiA/AmiB activator)
VTNKQHKVPHNTTVARCCNLFKRILAASKWLNTASKVLKSVRSFSIACLICTTTSVCGSEDGLEPLRTRIEKLENSLARNGVQLDSARNEVLDIERLLFAARKRNEHFSAQLDEKKSKIQEMTDRRQSLLSAHRNTTEALGATIAARYSLWNQPKIKLLLNGKNIAELQRYLQYYDYVAASNAAKLAEYSQQVDSLRDIEGALKLEADKLRQLESQSRSHLEILDKAVAGRSHIALALDQLLRDSDDDSDRFESDESQLSTLVDEVTQHDVDSSPANAPFRELKGRLSWPTTGAITKAPGHAMHAGGAKWNGVVIKSEPGSDVKAIASGKIVFADWFRNLGLLVIVDHGDGFMSLYGHNQELYKDGGDDVEAGGILATVGDTGGRVSSGLYFEIRQNGMAEDPRLWCRN